MVGERAMNMLRRAVLGIGEFCALMLVIVLTIGGGWLGYRAASNLELTTAVSLSAAVRSLDIGVIIGAIAGFVFSMVIAATLSALVEIAKNTSERWFE